MKYTAVSTVAEKSTSLFPLAVGSSLNNESNFLKVKFTVERNNVFHGSCTLCFFFGLHSVAYTWLCISCFREVTFTFIQRTNTLYPLSNSQKISHFVLSQSSLFAPSEVKKCSHSLLIPILYLAKMQLVNYCSSISRKRLIILTAFFL